MGILDRFRSRRRAADLTDGFWVAEAVAMQRSIEAAREPWESGEGPMPVELGLEAGPAGRVVVVWRNRIVGFAPPDVVDRLPDLLAPGPATVSGDLYRHGTLWRLWAGPRPASGPPDPDPDLDRLPAPPLQVFGLRLDALERERPAPRDR